MNPQLDPRVAEAIDQLEQTGLAAELFGAEWEYLWLSPQMRAVVGADGDEQLGIGRHYLETRALPVWRALVTREMEQAWIREFGPFMAHDTPGGVSALLEMADDHLVPALREVEPREAPPVFTTSFEVTQPELTPTTVSYVMVRLRGIDGALLGNVLLYTSPLPATVLALVARGDAAMFGRAAELIEPGDRAAAILFADLEASGALSSRLPSAVYFRLLSELTTRIDAEVGRRKGLVGKHAGDGVTAFFLTQHLGSDSAAARAALETAMALVEACAEVAAGLGEKGFPLEREECRLNIGLHWGGSLYLGQVVTGGRLEVTSLGDEMNECARIEQTARRGQLLASKALIERLEEDDARAVGLGADELDFKTLAELGGASEKALRDAGTLALTDLSRLAGQGSGR